MDTRIWEMGADGMRLLVSPVGGTRLSPRLWELGGVCAVIRQKPAAQGLCCVSF